MTRLAALHARITGDASGFVKATQAAGAAGQRLTGQLGTGLAAGTQKAKTALTAFSQSNAMRMLPLQFSQVAQQAAAGGGVFRALTIQAADIGLAFGKTGVIVGILATVAMPVLMGAFSGAKGAAEELEEEAEELQEILNALAESSNNAADAAGGMGQALEDLITIGGAYGDRAREIAQANREIEFANAAASLREVIAATGDVGDLDLFRSTLESVAAAQENISTYTDVPELLAQSNAQLVEAQNELQEYADRLDMSVESVTSLVSALDTLGEAGTPTEQAEAARRVAEEFLAAAGSVGEMTLAERNLFAQLLETEQAALRLAAVEQRRSAFIAETGRELINEIHLQRSLLHFGEESAEVQRLRARFAREEFQARIEANGAAGAELETLMSLYDQQVLFTQEAEATADAVALIAGSDISTFEGQVIALANELGIAADEAARLLRNLPHGTTFGVQLGAGDSDLLPPTDEGGGGGGGGARRDTFEQDLERLRDQLASETELEAQMHEERLDMLNEALERELLSHEEGNRLIEAERERHHDAMAGLDVWRYGTGVEQTEAFMGQMASAFASGNEEMMRISKVFGAGEALINAWRTFTQVMADPSLPFFAKLPAAISLFGSAVQAVSAIQGVGKGGSGRKAVGGATAGGAGSIAAPEQGRPVVNRSLTLIGESFNRKQAIQMGEFFNDGTDDGLTIRGRR